MDVLAALTLIGLAVFLGGIFLRRLAPGFLAIGAVFVLFGLGIPALVIDDNRSESASSEPSAAEGAGGGGGGGAGAEGGEGGGETAQGGGGGEGGGGGAAEEGKLIFTQNCGTCHVLEDAGTQGQVGPPLDPLRPNEQRTLAAIENGGTGSGTMPANIVTGDEAQAVAEYVASVAGR